MDMSLGGTPAVRRGSSAFPCCNHCGHVELGESPGHEYPCRVPGCGHHVPDFCPHCASELIRYNLRTFYEPFWWCRTCHSAHWCFCEGCEVMRALRADA